MSPSLSYISALKTRHIINKSEHFSNKTIERLSSGKRINNPSDDAAGLFLSNKMTKIIRGNNKAIANLNDGTSAALVAESGIREISNILLRLKELSVQMDNGIYTDADLADANIEVTQLMAEIDKIANNTNFNSVNLLDGSYNKDIHAGPNHKDGVKMAITDVRTSAIMNYDFEMESKGNIVDVTASGSPGSDGVYFDVSASGGSGTGAKFKVIISGGSITSVVATNFGKNYKKNDTLTLAGASVGGNALTLNVDTVQTGAKTAYSTIETAIEKVTNAQSHLGAMQNRFAHNISHSTNYVMRTEEARGRIVDADFAIESINLTKQQILRSAATAMLAQANENQLSILNLIQ